jgi:hypothetical protein
VISAVHKKMQAPPKKLIRLNYMLQHHNAGQNARIRNIVSLSAKTPHDFWKSASCPEKGTPASHVT